MVSLMVLLKFLKYVVSARFQSIKPWLNQKQRAKKITNSETYSLVNPCSRPGSTSMTEKAADTLFPAEPPSKWDNRPSIWLMIYLSWKSALSLFSMQFWKRTTVLVGSCQFTAIHRSIFPYYYIIIFFAFAHQI